MTREDLEKLWPILEAYRQGKTIEVYNRPDNTWYELDDPGFDGDPDSYRVAPEPKYRPFKNSEECWEEMVKHQPFGWISLDDKEPILINHVTQEGVQVGEKLYMNFKWAMTDKHAKFVDGTPFGVKKEEDSL